jgi:hypothetical protein
MAGGSTMDVGEKERVVRQFISKKAGNSAELEA